MSAPSKPSGETEAGPLSIEELAEAVAYFDLNVANAVSHTPAAWWADKYGVRLLVTLDSLRAENERLKSENAAQWKELNTVNAQYVTLRQQSERYRVALEACVLHIERNECQHEETHRGGVLWTICSHCNQKWADDEGGFVPYQEPACVVAAREALSVAEPQAVEQEQQIRCDECDPSFGCFDGASPCEKRPTVACIGWFEVGSAKGGYPCNAPADPSTHRCAACARAGR